MIARALMSKKLLIRDEPTAGAALNCVVDVFKDPTIYGTTIIPVTLMGGRNMSLSATS